MSGSHLYGWANPNSDKDFRGIFLNTKLSDIIGITKCEHYVHQDIEKDEDYAYYELRYFFRLLQKTNTQLIELLYLPEDKFIELNPLFKELVLKNRQKFIDTKSLYKSLKGYIQGERRRANGLLTGKLGAKRQRAVEQFSYSPKNMIHLIRLATTGYVFFTNGVFPSDFMDHELVPKEPKDKIFNILDNPSRYSVDYLNGYTQELETVLDMAYDANQIGDFKFDVDYVAKVCYSLYMVNFSEF